MGFKKFNKKADEAQKDNNNKIKNSAVEEVPEKPSTTSADSSKKENQ